MRKILLIEPDNVSATLIKKSFERHSKGVKLFHACSAQEAVSLADKSTPDLVILELALTEHNGLAFLHEFRSYADWTTIPIIIHTHLARSSDIIKNQIDNLNIKGYLYKPTTTLARLVDDSFELLAI